MSLASMRRSLLTHFLQELLVFWPIDFWNFSRFHCLLESKAKIFHQLMNRFQLTILGAFFTSFVHKCLNSSAHIRRSLHIVLEIMHPLGQNRIIHVSSIGAVEIVHQFSQRGIAAALSVHIEDVGPILKGLPRLPDIPVDVVNGQALMQHVSLGDENDIGLAEGIVPVTGAGQVGIQQTAVVPGPVGVSPFIPTLDLYIVCTSRFVYSQNVQPDGPALKIFDVMLPVDLHYTPYFFRFAKDVFRKLARYSQFFQFTILSFNACSNA